MSVRSAGLNLHWDRYHHRYEYPSGTSIAWGARDSAVQLSTMGSFYSQVRGTVPLPTLPEYLRIAWRAGIDLNPIDVTDADAMRWLRALIFPEHLERHQEIEEAAPFLPLLARSRRPRSSGSDCDRRCPDALARPVVPSPPGFTPVVVVFKVRPLFSANLVMCYYFFL